MWNSSRKKATAPTTIHQYRWREEDRGMGPNVLNCKQFLWHTSGSGQLSFHSTIKKLVPLWDHSQQRAGHSQTGFGNNFRCMGANCYICSAKGWSPLCSIYRCRCRKSVCFREICTSGTSVFRVREGGKYCGEWLFSNQHNVFHFCLNRGRFSCLKIPTFAITDMM